MRGIIANGSRIVSLRNARGLTQEKLAADCECDVKTIRSTEHSKRVDVATLGRIAARLGVEYREIVAEISPDRREVNVAAAMAFVRAFDARDPDAVSHCFCEDGAVVVFADPRLPGAGEYRGRERVREWARICFAAFLAEPVTAGTYHFEAVGDLVFFRRNEPRLESLTTGRSTTASVMSEFEVADGKILALRIFPESGAVERIALPEGARPESQALAAKRTAS